MPPNLSNSEPFFSARHFAKECHRARLERAGVYEDQRLTVQYSTSSQWSGGFTANVVITDKSTTAINGWTLAYTYPGDQKITNAWNAAVTQSGEAVAATNLGYDAAIPVGGSTSFGVQGTWTAGDAVPTGFTLNGVPCTG
jgi:hypothetical protein